MKYNFCLIFLIVINFANAETNIENDIKTGLVEQSFLYGVATVSSNIENNTQCNSDFREFLNAINLKKSWALKMLDASGQEETGYLFSNYLWMGSMSLCKNIQNNSPYDIEFISVLLNHNNSMQLQLYLPNNEYLQLGLCVPKSCKTYDIHRYLNQVLIDKRLNFMQNHEVKFSIAKIKSFDTELNTWADNKIVTTTIIIFVSTFILSILGTLYDTNIRQPHLLKQSYEENKWWTKVLLCYSIPANIKSLFDTKIKAGDSMPVVHGLKTFGMFYIVFVHYPLYISMTTHNVNCAVKYSTAWYFQLFYKSAFSVDTYFCLGGFLISYLFFKAHKEGKSYSLPQGIKVFVQMIVHRIIRLLPAYVVTISLVVTVWRWLEQSYPIFRVVDAAEDICPNYWWRNLLFITTWHPRSEMCITWTWYLSEDMQFYVVNCALLILATKYLKPVIYFMKLLVLYSIFYAAWMCYKIEYIPTLPAQMRVEVMYYPFAIRMSPYFVGVIAGYYFNTWGGKLPLTKNGIYKGWLLFILNALFVVQSLPYPNQASFAFNVFYVGITRTLWGVGIAWLLMACISGYGGIINQMLSFNGWIPFSRTTFCVYLTNIMIVNIYGYTGEEASYFSINHQLYFLVGNIVLCFIVGLIFSILFESPVVQLTKLLLKPSAKRKTKKEHEVKVAKYDELDANNYVCIKC